jgi:hypothetical protein
MRFTRVAFLCTIISQSCIHIKGLPSGEIVSSEFKNLVVVPDIHGDSESFIRSLWLAVVDVDKIELEYAPFRASLLDAVDRQRATGDILQPVGSSPISVNPRDTVLVQLGDVADRGPDTLLCYWILDVIQPVIGWTVRKLYGNHELISHQDRGSEYVHILDSRRFDSVYGEPQSRSTQMSASGDLWRTISHDTLLLARFGSGRSPSDTVPAITSSSTLLVHGGIDVEWVSGIKDSYHRVDDTSIIDDLNRVVQGLVRGSHTDRTYLSFNTALGSIDALNIRQSPLWIRDIAELNEAFVCEELLNPILKYFSVARLIVGHTPQKKRMVSRCGSRLILADASMSKWMRKSKWLLTDLDENQTPEIDPSDGTIITGNPSVLVMKHSSSALVSSMESLYFDQQKYLGKLAMGADFDDRSLIIRDALFPIPQTPFGGGLRSFRGNLLVRMPQAGAIGKSTYYCEGTTVDLHMGHSDMLFAYMGGGSRLGLPEVKAADAIGESLVRVLLDTCGTGLRDVVMRDHKVLSLAVFRQILTILKNLESKYLTLAHVRNEPAQVLEYFVIDTYSGLVTLADLSVVETIPDPSHAHLTIETRIAPVLGDLELITKSLIGNKFEPFDLVRVANEYWPKIRGSILRHKMTGVAPPRPEVAIRATSNFVIEKEWSLVPIEILWQTQFSKVTEVVYKTDADDYKSGVMLKIKESSLEFDRLTELVQGSDVAAGIPEILKTRKEDTFSGFWLFNFMGISLKANTVFVDSFDVAKGIFDIVGALHKNGLLIGSTSPGFDLLEPFFLHVTGEEKTVHLVDVSHLREGQGDDFEIETAFVKNELRRLFPSVILDDDDDLGSDDGAFVIGGVDPNWLEPHVVYVEDSEEELRDRTLSSASTDSEGWSVSDSPLGSPKDRRMNDVEEIEDDTPLHLPVYKKDKSKIII